jgi:atypical dual specificity phosphatase
VTRDDLVMTSGDLDRFVGSGHVVVAEEKVDGANLGFSLSKDYEVKAQNRSHWVCASSHSQFKGLDKWLDEHSWALCRLLAPEEEVLFGEWCYARHSVPYTRLPGYFIAFDIYNKRSGQFASVDERNRRLEGLEIPIVPTLARKVFGSRDELLALPESRSAYYDGFVEGAYLRVDEVEGAGGSGGGLHNSFRGKLVRPDFIQGIKEHWQSRTVERNGLAWAS